jgi:hypothetical protein
MTFDEKMDTYMKSIELKRQGKLEEATRVQRSVPMLPWLAEWYKKRLGAERLIAGGWNLSEAEEQFGHDWLTR